MIGSSLAWLIFLRMKDSEIRTQEERLIWKTLSDDKQLSEEFRASKRHCMDGNSHLERITGAMPIDFANCLFDTDTVLHMTTSQYPFPLFHASSKRRKVTPSLSTKTLPLHPSFPTESHWSGLDAPAASSLLLITGRCASTGIFGATGEAHIHSCAHSKDERVHLCLFCSRKGHHAVFWSCRSQP